MLDKDYLIKGDMYQYNLGWLIQELLSFKQDLATAIDLKTIKYADPIQWDITTQYPANTVVVDPKSGTAYMSKVPVPAGVELTNTNYWVVVFNYQDIYNKIMDGVAFNDRDQDYATKDLLVNDLVWYAGDLYRVTRAIPTGSKYIPGTNLIKTSIESLLARYYGRDRTAQVSNDTINVSGDFTLIAGDIAETADNKTVKTTNTELDTDSLVIKSVNPIQYGSPQEYDAVSKVLAMRDASGTPYNIAVPLSKRTSYMCDTVQTLKVMPVTAGTVTCNGYDNVGDMPQLTYRIDSTGNEDGGSVIKLNNDYYAHALFPDFVYPEWFGIKNSDTPVTKNSKWDNLISYCENNSKYIKLLPHTYEVNKTIYTRVAICGSNSTSTHFNPYITKSKPIRSNNDNVSCIKAVSPFTYSAPTDVTTKALILFDIRKNDTQFNGTDYPQNAVISNFAIDANGITESGLCMPYYNNAEIKELEIGGATKYDIQLGLVWMCFINNVIVYSDKSIRGLFWDSSFIPSTLTGTTNTVNNLHFVSVANNYIPVEMNIFYTTIFNNLAFDIFNSIDCFIKITSKGTLTLNQPHFEPRENVKVGCLIDCFGTLNLTIDMLSLQFTTSAKLNYLFKLLNGNISIVNSDITNGINGMSAPLYLYTGVANLVFEMNLLGLIVVPAEYQTTQSGNMLIIFKSRGGYYYLSRLTSSETVNMTKLYGA